MTDHDPSAIDSRFARRSAWIDRAVGFVFVAILCAPHVDHLLREDAERGPFREQRNAATRPTPAKDSSELRAYPLAYQNYWNDAFGLRDVLLHGNALLKALGFGVLPGSDHVLGKDGWIFWRGKRVLDVWRGVAPLTTQELEDWRIRLEHRRTQCAALGAKYLFVICPEKPTVYPEFLPDRFDKVGPSRLDQLLEFLRGRSDVDVLDLRPVLLAAKADDRPGNAAYYEVGTHWRSRGAALGCAAILEHLKSASPALTPLPLSQYIAVAGDGQGDTEARALYLEREFPQLDHAITPKVLAAELLSLGGFPRVRSTRVASRPELPKAVVFHDSFGVYLEKPMAEAFSRLTMVWNYVFDEELVKREKPDVVVEMFAERTLYTLDPRDLGSRRDPVREAFEASSDVRYRLDPTRPESLTAMYRAKLAAKSGQDGATVVAFTGLGAPDCFVLPEFDLTAPRLLVRLDVTSPEATTLAVHYKRRGDPNYDPERRVEIALDAGRTETFLEIPEPALVDRLIVTPSRLKGEFLFHAVEVRAASR